MSPIPPVLQQADAAPRRSFWPVLFLLVAVGAVYLPTIGFEFQNLDDTWYVARNDLIRSWSPANLYRIATEVVARNYAPLTIAALLVEHTLFGDWAGGYHLVNVLLHAVNAVLVYRLLRQLTRDEWLSWLTAGLFALHPVQVESVAWVSNIKTLLSAQLALASLICWLRTERTSRDELLGTVWLALSLLSRASAVTLPVIVFAYDMLVARKPWKEAAGRQLIPVCGCAVLLMSTMDAQTTYWGGVRQHLVLNKLEILAVDTTILMRYAAMLVWPTGLCVLYDPPFQNIAASIFLCTLIWGLIGWKLWSVRQTCPLATLAGVVWIALFLPVINLFPLTSLMNDRYLYLTCVPFFALLAAGVRSIWMRATSRLPSRQSWNRPLAAAASLALLAAATLCTHNYLPVWRNPETLWMHARLQTPTLPLVQIQWALTLRSTGRPVEAVAVLRHTLEHCHPDEGDIERIERWLSELEPVTAGIAAAAPQMR